MADIIQLLPDAIANQIAAGEVVQRPASAVKELMENAIDAGATNISLIIKDAGKTLIQVIDNGTGMSETDARLCLERHATSKIRKAEDLFSIRTMGFRGEAIASIAAISQMEIKSRTREMEVGTLIKIQGSKVELQESCACPAGTNISVKNLFFNVPARRNFLKSTQVETRHIIEEFQRIALTNPQVTFSMQNNGQEVFNLPPGSFRQRITAIYGSKYNNRLVPVKEETDVVSITGFVTKPEFAKKTRGEQYFFVNNRFIKSPYLHHAVKNAYDELIPDSSFPSYFLQMEIDPNRIDINIHPTKTEVKFEEERNIYAIIRTAVKQALGKYNIAPSLDFEQETSFNVPSSFKNKEVQPPTIQVDPTYNPFEREQKKSAPAPMKKAFVKSINQDWEVLYRDHEQKTETATIPAESNGHQQLISPEWEDEKEQKSEKAPVQIHNRYILSPIKSGILLIDQHRAHQRIIYEKMLGSNEQQKQAGQRLLFPLLIELNPGEFELFKEISEELTTMGFELNEFGNNSFTVTAIPVGAVESKTKDILESILEQYKQHSGNVQSTNREVIVRALSKKMAIPAGKVLGQQEMNNLIDELFACSMPYSLADGKPIIVTMQLEELNKRFQ